MASAAKPKAATIGKQAKTDLPAELFSEPYNESLVHEAARADRNARRQGSHSSLTRGEVAMTGAKASYAAKVAGRGTWSKWDGWGYVAREGANFAAFRMLNAAGTYTIVGQAHPQAAMAAGELKLHAWVYKMETGEVFAYDPASGQYNPLLGADGATYPITRGPVTRAGTGVA